MADAVIEIPARKGKAQTPATSKSSTRTANKSSTPGRSIATTLPSSCQWSIPGRTRSIFHRAGGRQLAQQQAAPDADRHRGYIRGHPRHANRRLRSISYAFLGVAGHHDNCADNLQLALHELHFARVHVPSPLNLFMHIPWDEAGGLQFAPPPARSPGSYVLFRAEMDLVIAFSACPQDVLPINGRACRPVAAHVMVI
jgi:hypothetical protein